ncbi:MAG TPA: phosphopentomutase [Candidatus Atribacteria bacterium]|nr:phosphopentomutase [Candidatus Atribacteria bacterium]
MSKVILIVMDSVGIGELPDASKYGDEGSDTLGNIISDLGSLEIPNMIRLGLGNITNVNIPYSSKAPIGCFGKAAEASAGKDTTTGHWEIAGLQLKTPFPVYPDGFPKEVMDAFHAATGVQTMWNKPASGSEIIQRLGEEHMKTGKLIVYTSADSVFQIAAHEEIVPVEKLYEYCRAARGILQGPHAVGRVIARPFAGEPGNFQRTMNRKDFSLPPVGNTILDLIIENSLTTVGIGKIGDIFANRGLSRILHTKDNDQGIDVTLEQMKEDFDGLIFTNLVDFDMLYGHRNNTIGYARALEAFDRRIPELMDAMGDKDILIITADHGCDPTTPSTDHSREYVPILVYGRSIKAGVNLGIRATYSDIGATVLDLLGIQPVLAGSSFTDMIL